jgi:hypothetical protein
MTCSGERHLVHTLTVHCHFDSQGMVIADTRGRLFESQRPLSSKYSLKIPFLQIRLVCINNTRDMKSSAGEPLTLLEIINSHFLAI